MFGFSLNEKQGGDYQKEYKIGDNNRDGYVCHSQANLFGPISEMPITVPPMSNEIGMINLSAARKLQAIPALNISHSPLTNTQIRHIFILICLELIFPAQSWQFRQ